MLSLIFEPNWNLKIYLDINLSSMVSYIRTRLLCAIAGGFKKTFWVLVMLGMAAVLLYNVVELSRKYFSYPISVKLSVDHQQQLMFPTVAICNMSPVKKSSLLAAQNSASAKRRRRKRSVGKYSEHSHGNRSYMMYSCSKERKHYCFLIFTRQ